MLTEPRPAAARYREPSIYLISLLRMTGGVDGTANLWFLAEGTLTPMVGWRYGPFSHFLDVCRLIQT